MNRGSAGLLRAASGSRSRSPRSAFVLRGVDLGRPATILRTAAPAWLAVMVVLQSLGRPPPGGPLAAPRRPDPAVRFRPMLGLPARRLPGQQHPAGAARRARPEPLPRRPRGDQPGVGARDGRRRAGRGHGRGGAIGAIAILVLARPRRRGERGAGRPRRRPACSSSGSPVGIVAHRLPGAERVIAHRRAAARGSPSSGAGSTTASRWPGDPRTLAAAIGLSVVAWSRRPARVRGGRPGDRHRADDRPGGAAGGRASPWPRRSRPGRATSARSSWRPSRSATAVGIADRPGVRPRAPRPRLDPHPDLGRRRGRVPAPGLDRSAGEVGEVARGLVEPDAPDADAPTAGRRHRRRAGPRPVEEPPR